METEQQKEYGGERWLPKLLTGRFKEAAEILRESRRRIVQATYLSDTEINRGLRKAESDLVRTNEQQPSA